MKMESKIDPIQLFKDKGINTRLELKFGYANIKL